MGGTSASGVSWGGFVMPVMVGGIVKAFDPQADRQELLLFFVVL
jgi:hypothetical protein